MSTVAALALAAVFALSGCVRMDLDLTVGGDDTVDGSIVFAVDRSLLTIGGSSPENAFRNAEGSLDALPEGSGVEVYDDGRFYGRRVVYHRVPFARFNSGRPGAPTFTHQDGRITFTADLAAARSLTGRQTPLSAPLLNGGEIRISLTFPGKVLEQSFGTVSGDTVTWQLGLGDARKLRAVAEDHTFPWAAVAVAGGAACLMITLVALVGGAYLLGRRRPARSGAPEPALVAPESAPAPVDRSPVDGRTAEYPVVPPG